MSYLLYCIVEPGPDGPPLQPGMGVVAADGLAAVVAPVEETSLAPSVSSVLAFEKAVEAIHAGRAVIPLRYGCLMESESAILRLLRDQQEEYLSLLARLGGTPEMGIRVLCPARPTFPAESGVTPGAAYLASLRKRYGSANSLTPEEAQQIGRASCRE